MAIPTAAKLLKSLDRLEHGARAQRVSQLGAQLNTDEFESLVVELQNTSDEGAHVAIALATRANRPEVMVGLSTHQSAYVREHATRALEKTSVSSQTVVELWPRVSETQRASLLRLIRKQCLSEAAEVLISERIAIQRDVGRLLSACADTTVRRLLPEHAHTLGSWSTLADRHPDPVLEYFTNTLNELGPQHHHRWMGLWSTAWLPLATHRPLETIAVLNKAKDVIPYVYISAARTLLRLQPEEFGQFMVSVPHPAVLVQAQGVHKLLRVLDGPKPTATGSPGVTTLEQLARKLRTNSGAFATILRSVAPSRRPGLLAAAYVGLDLDQVEFDSAILELLPSTECHLRARCMLQLPNAQSDSNRALYITSFLPPAEALPILEPAARRSDADLRGQGLQLIISCIGRSRDESALAQLPSYIGRLTNEQDPVRMVAVNALAACPITAFNSIHGPMFTELAKVLGDARDTSWSTKSGLQRVLTALVVHHASDPDHVLFRAGLNGLDLLANHTGAISFPYLAHRISAPTAFKLIDTFLPTALKRFLLDDDQLALNLAGAVGRHGWAHDGLQNALEQLCFRSRSDATAESACRHWLADPQTRPERSKQLVEVDETWLLNGTITQVANCRAQLLLDLLLSGKVLKGRFGSKRSVLTLPLFAGYFHRWGPSRRAEYAKLVQQVLAKTGPNSVAERANTLRFGATLPEHGTELVDLELRYSNQQEVYFVEGAIAALATTSRPDLAIPRLLESADGDRARVAIYSLRRAIRRSLPGDSTQLLITTLTSDTAKLTSKKELIRLLAASPNAAGTALLTEFANRPVGQLHRDLRIALATAGRDSQESQWVEAAWRALAAGGIDEQWALTQFEPTRIGLARRELLGELLLQITKSPEDRTRQAAFAALMNCPGLEEKTLAHLVSALNNFGDRGWNSIVGQLAVQLNAVRVPLTRTSEIASSLVQRFDETVEGADLPARIRLKALATILSAYSAPPPDSRVPTLRALSNAYAAEARLLKDAIALYAATIEWGAPTTDLDFVAELVKTSMVASSGGSHVGRSLERLVSQQGVQQWNQMETLDWCRSAMQSPGAQLRLLAVMVARVAGSLTMWAEPWRSLVNGARADADLDVATAASETSMRKNMVPAALIAPSENQELTSWLDHLQVSDDH
jgi:hypothetical protein